MNIHVGQKVAPAAHFRKPNIIQNLPFRRFFNIMFGQIKHLVNSHISAPLFLQLLLPHFIQVVSILVCNHLAARITFHRNDHFVLMLDCWIVGLCCMLYLLIC